MTLSRRGYAVIAAWAYLVVTVIAWAPGYIADSLILFTTVGVEFRFAPYTFVGEMTLTLWLFFIAGKPGRP